MKKFIFSIFLLLTIAKTQAQYVNIPDSNFRNFLIAKYPACFNASKQMDTTCGAVVNEDSLTYTFLENTSGLQYFKRLKFLDCSSLSVPILTNLPDSITYLICGTSSVLTGITKIPETVITLFIGSTYNMTTLPTLPNSLKYLYCGRGENLTSLSVLPNSLEYLDCSESPNLKSLPSLPSSLTYLDCSACDSLSTLPIIPNSLKKLKFSNCRISVFPNLPNSLVELNCSSNPITSISSFPDSLSVLDCGNTLINSLPVLPVNLLELNISSNTYLNGLSQLPNKLQWLFCGGNHFNVLPNLPSSLKTLHCFNNTLTTLPPLPIELKYLYCYENPNLYCLPMLPNSLLELDLHATKIKCLSNIPVSCSVSLNYDSSTNIYNTIGLCNPTNNQNHCQSFPVMSGTVFYDNNSNGGKDATELYRGNVRVQLSNGRYTFTNKNGYFEMGADSIGAYTLTISNPNLYNVVPQIINYNFSSYDTLVSSSIALQPNVVKDSATLTITPINWRARPGFSFPYSISYENVGTTTINSTLIFSYDSSKLIYDSSSVSVTNTGNNLSLNVGNIVPGYINNIVAYFRVKITVPIGDSIVTNASLTAGSINVTTKDVAQVTGAFDPNDKQATPELYTTEVAQGKKIDYTIRFQNTGNDTAFHVVIADTLDSKLNLNSLQMVATSHNCKTTIKDNIIFFEMRDIMLPDSNVNYLASNGFIRFTMQPKNNVVAGDNIPNKAAIYFDYNAPVITNTVVTQIKNLLLPVTFMSYILKQAQDNKNEIENTWTTANEVNLSHYIVQRSDDGRVFKSVGKVDAVGVSSYTFIDNKLPIINNTKTFYYRVIAFDKNGNYQFTEVRQITINEKQPTIHIYPNPAKDIVNIGVDAATTATIVNAQGQTVKTVVLQKGSNNINLASLPNGVYYLKTENNYERLLIAK